MGKRETLYSIIVPIYNVENYLPQCINSLIEQTYSNIEIILVDDGSPDNCPKICDEYAQKDNRIKIIHKKNGGLVSARKAGVNIATGDYVFCVDGDDWVVNNMVEKVDKILKKYSCDVVCFGFFKDREDNPQKINFKFGFYDKENIVKSIFPYLIEHSSAKYFPNNLCGKCLKKDIYEKEQNKVNDSIKIGEDLACTKPIISKSNSLYIMEDCLYFYRTNLTSMTKEKKPFAWEVPELIYNHLIENLNQSYYDFTDQLHRNIAHNIFNVVVSQFYRKDISKREIINEIKEKICSNKVYKSSVVKAKYTAFKGKMMLFLLRHNCYSLINLYSKGR